MKLVKAQVNKFRSIVDSTGVGIEPDVTCLVGKNESGKTAFLQALTAIKSARPNDGSIDVTSDYPRVMLKDDRRSGDVGKVAAVTVWFELEDDDVSSIEHKLGSGVVSNRTISLFKRYDDTTYRDIEINEAQVVQNVLDKVSLPADTLAAARKQPTVSGLIAYLEGLGTTVPAAPDAIAVVAEISDPRAAAYAALTIPKFFYFSEYSVMPGRVENIAELLAADPKSLDDNAATARALLELADATGEEITDENYESRKAELEATSISLSREIFEYWTQNPGLKVLIDIDKKLEPTPTPHMRFALDVRVWDERHQMSTNFSRRSSGFVWFFSFLAAFSEYREKEPLIILLDEPGLGLHARAQADLLRYIEEKLAPKHQVIYSTHSPFMVDPHRLDRVRMVEDKPELGSQISSEILATDPDTLFPLQAALGYDIAQSLFVGPNNLVVEGNSDFIYLTTLSALNGKAGKATLDERWTITPVGGADKIPTFIALLGVHLPLAVLVDTPAAANQRLQRMIADKMLDSKHLVTPGDFTKVKDADIEDLFTDGEYLDMYNGAFGAAIAISDLSGSDSIIRRISRHIGREFDHMLPALFLLKPEGQKLQAKLSQGTLDRFAALFDKANAALPIAAAEDETTPLVGSAKRRATTGR